MSGRAEPQPEIADGSCTSVAAATTQPAGRGLLSVGVGESVGLQVMVNVVAATARARRCLLVLQHGAAAHSVGMDHDVPPSALVLLGAAASAGTRIVWTPFGWTGLVTDGDETVGAVVVDGPEEAACRRAAVALKGVVAGLRVGGSTSLDRHDALQALVEVGHQIHAAESDTGTVLDAVVERAHALLRADVSWLALADHDAQESQVTVLRGARGSNLRDMRVRLGEGITGLAMAASETVSLDDETHSDPRLPEHVRARLREEGIVSLVCAPLRHDREVGAKGLPGGLIGSLLVGFRRRADVPSDARFVLTALSSQAATAIVNSRLYASLAGHIALLEHHFALNQALADIALSGGGPHAIAAELARVVDADVAVHRELPGAAVWRYPRHGGVPEIATDVEPEGWYWVTVSAGGERLARMGTTLSEPTEFVRSALAQGATAIALELVKEQAAFEAEWRVRGDLLEELIQVRGQVPSVLRRRATSAGVALERLGRIAVLRPVSGDGREVLLKAIRAVPFPTPESLLVGRRAELLVVALPDDLPPVTRWITAVLARADRQGILAACGLSGFRADFAGAFREGRAALELAVQHRTPPRLVTVDDLGPLTFLLDAPNSDQMCRLVATRLGPLVDNDRRRGSELLATLRVLLEVGGNRAQAAKRCSIHLNTVKYRIARVEELLGKQLSDSAVTFEINLAFSVLRILEAIGIDPFEAREPAP